MSDDSRGTWLLRALPGCYGSGIRIGVVDSGWDWSIVDRRVARGAGFVSEHDDFVVQRNMNTQDFIGHGTMCADLVLKVAPRATVIPLRVFGSRLETSPRTLACAIESAAEYGIHVLTVSVATRHSEAIQLLYSACERSVNRGVLIVASSFGSLNCDGGPAVFAPVIGVGLGDDQRPLRFAYRADEAIECVASAPSTVARGLGGQRATVVPGTSFATPTIAGIVALLLERYPGASVEAVRHHLARLAPRSQEES